MFSYTYVHCKVQGCCRESAESSSPKFSHKIFAREPQWTLIAGRVKTILGLALDYYSIQRTLCDGIAAPNITARCQSEIERVERQFDECMVFLLRVRDTPYLVWLLPNRLHALSQGESCCAGSDLDDDDGRCCHFG